MREATDHMLMYRGLFYYYAYVVHANARNVL